ncbi:phosphohydrolase [Catellatospora sp. TT07R-123]|uniref:HD domain-containing protein n=1 Tax=Catellatospora sp. TT07R-123 TaxID=2733863 RepID=UPI001B243FCC|nr:HD domain-containing protein [Catellatospora sp. TT07R-123]GHJ42787.1 phosphohydrolase [Catellatospora sp. TT07R-123]
MIPDDRQIRALHEQYAPTPAAFELVYTHCRIVSAVAEQLLDRVRRAAAVDIDADLIRAGCLLHDIGVYRLYDDAGNLDHRGYIRHGVLGHDLLREAGLPEALARFCSRHTGVGLSRDDVQRQGLPLPPGDYQAETAEEQLVMYADKFHSKTSPPVFLTAAAYADSVRRFGQDKADRFAAMVRHYGEPDLSELSRRFGHALV